MTIRALFYAYIFGGITFIPLLIAAAVFWTIYTSVPVGEPDDSKTTTTTTQDKLRIPGSHVDDQQQDEKKKAGTTSTPNVAVLASSLSTSTSSSSSSSSSTSSSSSLPLAVDDIPKTRKGWLTMRRTYEESSTDGSYVTLVRSFLDARSKDPKRSRPKDTWYAVLKGTVLYLYEDEGMSECEAAIEVAGHHVVIHPEGLLDGELFARRNAICLKPRVSNSSSGTTTTATATTTVGMPSVTREMKYEDETLELLEAELEANGSATSATTTTATTISKKRGKERDKEREKLVEAVKKRKAGKEAAWASSTPWFIFVRSNIDMEDWYLSLVHASDYPANSPALAPLQSVFQPADMHHLLMTLDEQPDVVPMRWLNALMGRIFFSYYRTRSLEDEIIRRLMKKLSKVKRPAFLTELLVTEVSVGNKAPFLSKPMLKELTKEGDAALQVHLQYKGEIRITMAATATINLGARFKSYVVKLTLAAVLRELEGNLLIKVKRPPSSRIWYAFTQTPRMVLDVEPIVSDRQITWSMILNGIEAKLLEIIQESVVMPNMDDISFFESSSYQRRGGIWPDASRYEKKAPPATEPALSSNIASASTPALDGVTVVLSNEPQPVALKHSRSAEDLKRDPTPVQSSVEPESISRSSTTTTTISDGGSTEDASQPPSRRSSRWGSITSTDSGSLLQVPVNNEEERGRTDGESPSSGRSRSTPRKSRPSRLDSDPMKNGDDARPKEIRRFSHVLRRTPSQQSSLRGLSQNSANSSSSSLNHSTKHADSSRLTPTTPSSISFFSTLKSHAGDKHALGNSAKEAMRKWGVNWGGVGPKKDNASVSDDMSDHGSVNSRHRVDSESGMSFAQRARASYAEVRAAVKDRLEEGRRSPLPPPTASEHERGSAPAVQIAADESPRTRSVFAEMQTTLTPPKIRAPSLSRTITERSTNGGEEMLTTASEPLPIHTQPMEARTMSIPGIHVSHRGDVMSMGYVAPATMTAAAAAAAAPSAPSAPLDPKAKTTTTMESVYRLWKSPVLSGQAAATEEAGSSNDRDVAPLSLNPVSTSPPRPPPLPPRSTPTAVSRADSETTREMTASDALKVIAKRASVERTVSSSSSSSSTSHTEE